MECAATKFPTVQAVHAKSGHLESRSSSGNRVYLDIRDRHVSG
jgi:hypothetical protein